VPIIATDILDQLLAFRKERNWEQFHTPKNLSAALSIEAAELLECFQWAKDGELSELVVRERTAIEEEVADIAILLYYLCHDLNIKLDVVIRSKIEKNKQKYPVSLARGTAKKYDRL
jgi:NTP pyrophosphatase (non-canonical NTP hydrolase)